MTHFTQVFLPKQLIALMALFAFLAIGTSSSFAVNIQTVTSPSGVKALLVEDYTVPIVSISVSFKGGASQDPEDKEGLLRLLSTMLDEGAGRYDNKVFQARVEELGVEMGFGAGRDAFTGRLRTLASEVDNAFEMFRLALNEPRFDAEPIDRMKTALITRLVRSKKNPNHLAGVAMRDALFAGHAYSRPVSGTEESLAKLNRDDLVEIHRKLFARDNLKIGVVGAISAEKLGFMLDTLFGSLPEKAELRPIPEIVPKFGKKIDVVLDAPQTSISLVYPGLKRSDKDFFAAHLMNHVLGGGSFSSRLYNEVREKRGLAYSVYSGISTYDHAAILTSGTGTRNDRADEALKVIKSEIAKMAKDGPTNEELIAAKKYVIGTYAISNLDTSTKIASVLVAIQDADLGIDYIDQREGYISSVTREDVQRIAKQLLSVEPTIVKVGPKAS
ncbi:MAG: peptidase M16 [Hyphomicrobiales bacterium]|nr:MAG: peptidase M16 [Hyphomicrobiales bacterium]